MGASPMSLYLLTEDADKVFAKAPFSVSGDHCHARDGYVLGRSRRDDRRSRRQYPWMIGTHKEEPPLRREMKKKMKEMMKAMSAGSAAA